MQIQAIKTKVFLPPKDNLDDLLDSIIPHLKENMIVALTSKVISICEARCIKKDEVEKEQLSKNESQFYLEKQPTQITDSIITITNNLLINGAGIDESNANDYYVLLPKDPTHSAQKIHQLLKEKSGLKSLAVLITDSHSTPLRRGASGVSIGFYGFEPLKDYRSEKDLFGRSFHFEVANLPDALAATAVLVMGEGNEQTPMALISDLPSSIKFINHPYQPENPDLNFYTNIDNDLFTPFLKPLPWKKSPKKS